MSGIKTYKSRLDCTCGCKGWWENCDNNKANREKFILSPPPSPNRTNDDWFTKENNPLYTGTSNISTIPNIPQVEYGVSAKYILQCIDRYYCKEN
tara:strand:- start:1081 stop:1365 length:285 start_codon:yes stop_codon:yes gene_type:complete